MTLWTALLEYHSETGLEHGLIMAAVRHTNRNGCNLH